MNLIDILWDQKRPQLPDEPIWIHDIDFCGCSITEKLSNVRSKMNEYQVDHLIVHRTDDVACKIYMKLFFFIRNLLF
jgi:Xaa-Pro aminopeptidase